MDELCYIHGVIETYDDYSFWFCFECGHVWQTQVDFQNDVDALVDGLNNAPIEWGRPDPPLVAPNPADPQTNIHCCPLCSHDW